MDAFVKSFHTYRTIKQAKVIAFSIVVDSLDGETSSVSVRGHSVGISDAGNWFVYQSDVYLITAVSPQEDCTVLTLSHPVEAFNRPIEFTSQPGDQSIGGFLAGEMEKHWIQCSDPVYAIPYLSVSNLDTTPFTPPELDSTGCYDLPSYYRLMRRSYRVTARFKNEGNSLLCEITRQPECYRQISFEDGNSKLKNLDYSTSGISKLTVFVDKDTGEKDANGDAIISRSRSEWYLSESGEVSQSVPDRRAAGGWSTISVKAEDEVASKVVETFAKNQTTHKLEFWSCLDLQVQDGCTFFVNGEYLHSQISSKRITGDDCRYYYKSGELATTATEKMRGAYR